MVSASPSITDQYEMVIDLLKHEDNHIKRLSLSGGGSVLRAALHFLSISTADLMHSS